MFLLCLMPSSLSPSSPSLCSVMTPNYFLHLFSCELLSPVLECKFPKDTRVPILLAESPRLSLIPRTVPGKENRSCYEWCGSQTPFTPCWGCVLLAPELATGVIFREDQLVSFFCISSKPKC